MLFEFANCEKQICTFIAPRLTSCSRLAETCYLFTHEQKCSQVHRDTLMKATAMESEYEMERPVAEKGLRLHRRPIGPA